MNIGVERRDYTSFKLLGKKFPGTACWLVDRNSATSFLMLKFPRVPSCCVEALEVDGCDPPGVTDLLVAVFGVDVEDGVNAPTVFFLYELHGQ